MLHAAHQLDRRDAGRRAAAHAVVDRDHLRHVGHLDDLAAVPGHAAAEHDRQHHQADVVAARG